jgi:cell pole-organizing protein PopZ
MSDLIQEHMTKPKSDDMSMDEILASIRKIISTSSSEDTQSSEKIVHNQQSNIINKETINREQSLSAREQLLALTKPNLYDSDFTPNSNFKKIPEKNTSIPPKQPEVKKYAETVYQKPFYDTLNKEAQHRDSDVQDHNHDSEILQALNEIRATLNHTNQSSPQEPLEKDIFNKANNPNIASREHHKTLTPAIDVPITKSKEAIFDEISLKSSQFTGDAVPEFLKKFKRQQELDKERTQKKSNNPQYDFSKVSHFDDTDDVVTLTEKIMPMSQRELQQHIQQEEKTNKKNFSKLREGTEEIMKRATERKFDDIPNDDLSEEDTPMANIIMRTLKPMLQEWIDENMHIIAEQVLRQELRRGLK